MLRTRPPLLALLVLLIASAAPAAQEGPPVPAPQLLEDHSNFFLPSKVYDLQEMPICKERLAPLAYRAYSAVGFNLANMILIVGPDNGLIVVDTLGGAKSAVETLAELRRKARLPQGKLPIKAIVYTHNHIDHTGGVEGVLAEADRPPCPAESEQEAGEDGTYIGRQSCVEVIAQEKIVDSVINTATVVGEIINTRSTYMYGTWIGSNRVNDGIGLEIAEGGPGFRMPSRTFSNELLFTAAGVNMKLIYVPSETDDELAVFLPDGINQMYGGTSAAGSPGAGDDGWGGPGMLLSAEVIQGPSFPNLYSLRGTSYRNPAQWFRSVDKLRAFDSWSMVPAHGVPLCGAADIRLLLRNFRDAVQFTHDQSVRFLNKGNTPEELAEIIRLPQYLINDLGEMKKPKADVHTEDYLRPFYGSVPQAVREIYFGYLGWFNGDPVALRPNDQRILAERTVRMMGGRETVLTAAQEALARGRRLQQEAGDDEAKLDRASAELEWAADLTTQVIRAKESEDGRSREVELCVELRQKFDASSPFDQCPKQKTVKAPTCRGEVYCKARETKAAAFLAMAEIPLNPNWRNWYISSAQELCGVFEGAPPLVSGLISHQIVSGLPPGAWVNSWSMRLKAEQTAPQGPDAHCPAKGGAGVHRSLGFWFRDAGATAGNQAYSLTIRCAIAEFGELRAPVTETKVRDAWADMDMVVALTRDAWSKLLTAEALSTACQDEEPFKLALRKALRDGGVQVLKGTAEEVVGFFDHFDPPPTTFPALTVR